jgi:hypothetical protein
VSEISKSWLASYDVVENKRMSKQEIRSLRSLLGGRLGATVFDRRQVILDSLIELDLDPLKERIAKAIITDCLAAHELGGAEYLGHFSLYCDPQLCYPDFLAIQEDLYIGTYLCQPLGSSQLGNQVANLVSRSVASLRSSEWFAEMLAIASEKERLNMHMAYRWEIPEVRNLLESWLKQLDLRKGGLSCYGTGLLVWDRLCSKFGTRIKRILPKLRSNMITGTPNAPPPENLLINLSPEGRRATLLLGRAADQDMYSIKPEMFALQLLDERVSPDMDLDTSPSVTKAYMLSWKAKDLLNWPGLVTEFPEVKALLVGDLWLAIHSTIEVQSVYKEDGMSSVYLKKNSIGKFSTNVVKLAVDFLRFRKRVMTAFRLQKVSNDISLNFVSQYLAHKISWETLGEPRPHTTIEILWDSMRDIDEQFLALHHGLREHYNDNREKIDRLLRDPQPFFSQVLKEE